MKAVVAVLALGAALAAAKPPPAPGAAAAPWAAYVGKPGVMGRSLVGLGDDPAAGVGSPMSPFLKLKPFLPAKPTFMPPVVDPSAFIDMKASLLNSLFPGGLPAAPAAPVYGAAPAAYSGLSERALLSPFAAPAAPAVTKPPPPAFLADLFKALNINKTVANATAPAVAPSAYPGLALSPFAAPAVDPGVFISKKAKFLSDLFAGLAVTTPAPVEEPVTADPAAVNAELAATLQRLLDSLEASGAQDVPEDEVSAVRAKRAALVDSAALVADAKDKVVDTIIGQLAELKNGMVDAVSDLAVAQKAADAANAAAAAAAAPKKPVSPYAAMWAKPAAGAAATTVKPPPAVEPVRQKVVLLGQVFDMLTDMEKDIATSMAVPPTTDGAAAGVESPAVPATPDLMDLVRAKIGQMVANGTAVNKTTSAAPAAPASVFTTAPKTLRLVPGAEAGAASSSAPVDPTFWIPDSPLVAPGAYLAKTKEFLANIMAAKSTPSPIVRRSYRPSYYQQTEGSPSAPSQQQQQPQAGGQQQKFNQQANPGAAIAYQLQQLHHHHHNRQPYWWN
ncbi:ice-structuring glycoprotein-like [Thrips palmi]|uniref:Ice-structuring glycoprotein-like n=1 Tax=Thrips palmi TaxID=161013 RepID=A0A6P8Z1B5_THRPL|nr:ice-structuring glycoprotein-like [Thrips palmi]